MFTCSSGFMGEGADTPPPSGIRPLSDPKGPPFVLFWDIHFWLTNLKIFLKSPLAPIYTNFEGERAQQKRNFSVETLPAAQKFWLKYDLYSGLGEQFGRPKKRPTNFSNFFFKSTPPPPPTLDKFLDQHLVTCMVEVSEVRWRKYYKSDQLNKCPANKTTAVKPFLMRL